MGWFWQNKKERWEKEREIYCNLADVVLVLDLEGKIVSVLKSNPTRHPVNATQATGKYLRELLGPEQGLKGAQAMREALGANRRTTYEYSTRVENGIFYYRAEIFPIPRRFRNREERILWLAYDCTAEMEAQASLWTRNELLEGVLKARISLMGENREGAHALDESLQIIGAATKASRVYILEHYQTPYYQVLSLQHEWCNKAVAPQMQNPKLEQIEYEDLLPGWLHGILKAGYRYFSMEDLPEKFREVMQVSSYQYVLLLPVFREERLWGLLGVEFHRPHRTWTDDEIEILRALSGTIGSWVNAQETRKELNIAKIEAEKANKAKSEFLAVISHELRTPMNAILGYAQLLRGGALAPEQKEQLSFIERSGRTLLELINNILDFSKIESQGVELENIPFNPEQVVIETVETCRIKAKEKGILLEYKMDGTTPKLLFGDPHRLKQILLNLVNNAVKFTSEGGVEVALGCKEFAEKVVLHGSVRDSGIGIAPEKASRLFRSFSQADSSTTRQYGGTGLGLAIAKRLVERMGGKIWLESAVGEGSTFHFTLQLARVAEVSTHPLSQATLRSATELPASEQTLKRALSVDAADGILDASFGLRFPMKILLVEDDPMNQRLELKLIDKLGFAKVEVAFDGIEGLKRISEGDYDAVLCDLQMPRLDGIGMTRRIRAGECSEKKRKLPVIGVTAYASSEDREKCLDAGMNEFIRKPIQVQELKEALILAYHQKVK